MKKIYCIEHWWLEDSELYNKYNSCEFWNSIEEPWKIGHMNFIQEYDSEEEFKNTIINILDNGGIIGKIWIKNENDNYKPIIKL